jgi:hypothetical protein
MFALSHYFVINPCNVSWLLRLRVSGRGVKGSINDQVQVS